MAGILLDLRAGSPTLRWFLVLRQVRAEPAANGSPWGYDAMSLATAPPAVERIVAITHDA